MPRYTVLAFDVSGKLQARNGRPSQKWQVLNGQIIGLGGKCLDTQGGGLDDRTPLVLNTCAPGVGTQIWTIQ